MDESVIMEDVMRKLIPVFLFVTFCSAVADGDYVPRTTQRVSDSVLEQYALVKISTTAKRVTVLLISDAVALMTGIPQNASPGPGNVVSVQELQGLSSNVVSDGTTTIAPGDLVQPSTNVNGRVMKGTASPICTALTSAAAVAGTIFQCL